MLTDTPNVDLQPDASAGADPFPSRWTNAKSALVGFLTGKGWSSAAIADHLADGTSPGTIRRMWGLWGISSADDGEVSVSVRLTVRERGNIAARAEQHQIPVESYIRQLVVSASMPRDRFSELVSGPGR